MTSSPINDLSAISVQNTMQKKSDPVGANLSDSFKNAMSQAKTGQTGDISDVSSVGKQGQNQPVKTTVPKPKAETPEKTSEEASSVKEEKEQPKTEPLDEASEKVEETAKDSLDDAQKEIVSQIADKLNVSEEDVLEAMELLGLTVMDLANQGNMAALTAQLTGNTEMEILTDETLFSQVKELTQFSTDTLEHTAEDVSKQLGITPEEASAILEQAAKAVEAARDEKLPDEPSIPQDTSVLPDERMTGENEKAVPVIVEKRDEKTDKGTTEVKSAEPETKADEISVDASASDEKPKAGEQQFDTNGGSQGTTGQTQVPNPDAGQPVSTTELHTPAYIDTQDVINQIADYVKITQSEAMTEMEMTLHPASLGNIHLQVQSREGVVTAQIIAQNENVKDAIMLQAATLKEQLNEQGLKVDAVEVTVESHEFERNMDQGGSEAKNLYEEQVQKQTRRRIVLHGLQDAEELLADGELDDADRLQVDMMAKSGNSVDFTA